MRLPGWNIRLALPLVSTSLNRLCSQSRQTHSTYPYRWDAMRQLVYFYHRRHCNFRNENCSAARLWHHLVRCFQIRGSRQLARLSHARYRLRRARAVWGQDPAPPDGHRDHCRRTRTLFRISCYYYFVVTVHQLRLLSLRSGLSSRLRSYCS